MKLGREGGLERLRRGAGSRQRRGCPGKASSALCFLYLIAGKLAAREGNCLLIRIIILGLKKQAAASAADFRGVPTLQAACLDYAFNIKDTERLIVLASAPLKGKKRS